MLMSIILALAAPQTCTEVRQECRACTGSGTERRCSNVGIACQPVVRICKPAKGAQPTAEREGRKSPAPRPAA